MQNNNKSSSPTINKIQDITDNTVQICAEIKELAISSISLEVWNLAKTADKSKLTIEDIRRINEEAPLNKLSEIIKIISQASDTQLKALKSSSNDNVERNEYADYGFGGIEDNDSDIIIEDEGDLDEDKASIRLLNKMK